VRQLTTVTLSYEAPRNTALFHPKRSAVLKLGLKEVGIVGEVHPYILQNVLETTENVLVFELNLDTLRRNEKSYNRYKPPTKFPAVEIDIAVVVDKPVTSHMILEAVKHTGGNLLADVSVFDVYEGDNIPVGKKSLAFHLVFLAHDRTLQDGEVTALREQIVQNLTDKYGALLRS